MVTIILCKRKKRIISSTTFKSSWSFFLSLKALANLAEVTNLVTFPRHSTGMPEHANNTVCPIHKIVIESFKLAMLRYIFEKVRRV